MRSTLHSVFIFPRHFICNTLISARNKLAEDSPGISCTSRLTSWHSSPLCVKFSSSGELSHTNHPSPEQRRVAGTRQTTQPCRQQRPDDLRAMSNCARQRASVLKASRRLGWLWRAGGPCPERTGGGGRAVAELRRSDQP